MSDFRKGDTVRGKPGSVIGTDCDEPAVRVRWEDDSTGWVYSDDLDLVERPGPRMEDLPHGTVIKTATSAPLIVSQTRHVVIGTRAASATKFDDQEQPFTVIGACPGTPAWGPFADAVRRANANRESEVGEWWRSE